jgi:hypothetical protein
MVRRLTFVSTLAAAAAGAYLREVALADTLGGTATLTSVIETLLPFGAAGFPLVSSDTVAQRVDSLFHLSESPAFAGSLATFSRLSEFSAGNGALFAIEQQTIPEVDVARAAAADALAFGKSGLPHDGTFASLMPMQRTAYLRLWSRSAFNTRRRFYQSVRFVTFAALYSVPDAWRSINYAGPILKAETR